MFEIDVTAITHRGKVRKSNEDTIAVGNWITNQSMDVPKQFNLLMDESAFLVVADGMGGHVAGEKASRMVALFLSRLTGASLSKGKLIELLLELNRELFCTVMQDNTLIGMGTTVAGVVASADSLLWFNVGDSRIYRFRDGFLRQLSVDDVPVYSNSRDKEKRITQAIGGAAKFIDIVPHVGVEPIVESWRYLLCSDGLTDMLPLDVIEGALVDDDFSSVQSLFDEAMIAGSSDNISIILATVNKESKVTEKVGADG